MDGFERLDRHFRGPPAGSKDITGDSNALGNTMTGNSGNNTLFGMDTLSGAAGNDTLEGGSGDDVFIFATGFGSDEIADSDNGADTIDLSDWADISGYADLILNHMTIDGSDIVFQSGSDSLRLRDVQVAEIDATDFNFV